MSNPPSNSGPSPDHPGLLNWLLILSLGVIWGGAFMGTAIALEGFAPWTVAAGRVAIATLVLAVVGAAMGQPIWRLGGPRAWGFATLIGVGAVALPFALLSWGLQHVPSAFAGVAMASVPLLLLPLVYLFSPEEGIGPRRILGVVLGCIGLVVLIGPRAFDPADSGLALWGQLACAATAMCYAVGSVLTRRAPKMPPIAFAGATMLTAAVALLPIMLWREGLPNALPLRPTLGLLGVAILPTALAGVMRVRIITTAGSLFMSITSYMVPIWAVIYGIVLMGEALPPQLFLALALILSGIAIAQSRALLARFRR